MNDYPWSHLRTEWENPNQTIAMHTGSPAFPWNTANLIAVHYTAANDVPDGDPDELPWDQHVAAYLRAIQNDYVTNRGYSIGYGCLVTQDGDDWQIRGVDWRNAANLDYNHRTFTILVFVDGADPLTPAAIGKIRDIVAWFRRESSNDVVIVGHQEIGATACPGAGVQSQIVAGLLEPIKENAMIPFNERLLDTRWWGKAAYMVPEAVSTVRAPAGVPTGATGLLCNLTTTQPQGEGFIEVWAGDVPPVKGDPSATNYKAGTFGRLCLIPLDDDGAFKVRARHAATHLIVDVQGYTT